MSNQFPAHKREHVPVLSETLKLHLIEQTLIKAQSLQPGVSRISVFSKIASALVQLGESERALAAVQTIQTITDRTSVLANVIPFLTEPQKQQAIAVALASISKIDTSHNRTVVLTHIADTAFSLPEPLRYQVAEQVLATAEALEYPFDLLFRVGLYLPEHCFTKVLLIAQHTKATAPLPRTLILLARRAEEQWRQKFLTRALEAIYSMIINSRTEIDARSGSRPKILALQEVGAALVQFGQQEEALRLAQTVTNPSVQAQVIAAVAFHLEEHKKQKLFNTALKLIQSHPHAAYEQALTLIDIAVYWPESLQSHIFDQALGAIQGIPSAYDQCSALSAVIPHLSPKAHKKALNIALGIKNPIATCWALTAMIPYFPTFQQQQMVEQVLEAANSLEQSFYQNDILKRVVSSLAQIGHIEQAFSLAQTIEDHTAQTLALANIVEVLPQIDYVKPSL